ncbi:MAG: phosphatase PAP2 family protein [Pseudomonadota bacterium]
MLTPRPTTFIRDHLVWPMLGFTLLVVLLALTDADILLADQIYQLSGSSWRLRDAWTTSVLLHEGGRKLINVAAVVLLLSALASLRVQRLKVHRRALFYLLSSALISGLIVNLLKQLTHVECPWDLVRYGGAYDYDGIFSGHVLTSHVGACFPAGHASAAYSWFGVYFIAHTYRPSLQRYALGGVVLLGLVFGIAQQLRGAHFISHDVWTVGICWLVATLVYMVFFREQLSATPGRSANRR